MLQRAFSPSSWLQACGSQPTAIGLMLSSHLEILTFEHAALILFCIGPGRLGVMTCSLPSQPIILPLLGALSLPTLHWLNLTLFKFYCLFLYGATGCRLLIAAVRGSSLVVVLRLFTVVVSLLLSRGSRARGLQ